jgi:PhzF family phenazine biosynthesis protein
MNMATTFHIVAAFSDDPNAGSPTGVVLDAGHLSNQEMQEVANQSGCSHTAFLSEFADEVAIRFFTPAGEIKNCAHATIAAHWLRATERSFGREFTVKQRTQAGVQDVFVRRDDTGITVSFSQNVLNFDSVDRTTRANLLAILGLTDTALEPQYPVILASPGAKRFLVGINAVTVLNALKPNFAALKTLCERIESIGCFVYTVGALTSPLEVNARMFAPAIGVDEDMINGNSSGCLGAYLLRLDTENRFGGELNLRVHQGQAFGRPGTVQVTERNVGRNVETIIGGKAALISQIDLDI